jgi:glycosyltransferase involved in cell wall biosynthesis
MKKVLFCCSSFDIGGFSSFALNLSSEFKKNNIRVSFLAVRPFGDLYNKFLNTFDEVFIIERGFKTNRNYVSNLKRIILERIKPDIIINSGVSYIQSLFPLLPDHIKRYTVLHSISEAEIRDGTFFPQYVNNIICVSKNVFKKAVINIKANNIVHIPVGIKIPNIKKEYKHINKDIQLVYVGRITYSAKNLYLMVDIICQLKKRSIPFEMTFIGDGDFMKELKSLLKRKNLLRYVNLSGAKNPDEIPQIIKNKDIFLMTSIYEGTPHALLEAMAFGIIPVVSDVEGIKDIIKENETGFLCNIENPDSFVTAIENIYLNKELKYKLETNIKKFVKENYSITNIGTEYMNLFEKNLNAKYPIIDYEEYNHNVNKISPRLARYTLTIAGDFYRGFFKGIKPFKYEKVNL